MVFHKAPSRQAGALLVALARDQRGINTPEGGALLRLSTATPQAGSNAQCSAKGAKPQRLRTCGKPKQPLLRHAHGLTLCTLPEHWLQMSKGSMPAAMLHMAPTVIHKSIS